MGLSAAVKKLTIDTEIWWEYEGERYPEICRCGNACAHITEKAEQLCDGVGLDIGAGGFPFGSSFPVRDSVNYIYRNGKQVKRPAPLIDGVNAYNLRCFADASMDYIFSSHCLEHLEKPFEALQLWKTKLKPGGILFLYLPHPDMKLWNPGSPWVRAAHKWKPTYEILAGWFYKLGFKIISGSPARDDFYSFHIVGRKNG
jgi:SAM-dependent methyltransferase